MRVKEVIIPRVSWELVPSYYADYLISFLVFFNMVVTRRFGDGSRSGSGSGAGGQDGSVPPEVIGQMGTNKLDVRICEILHDEVATLFRA